jgi:phage shock protein PspC (stress-responsive transcriptional regulator)
MSESDEQEKEMEATSERPTNTGYRAKRLTRSTDDRVIAGVAGGVAEHFDIDPVIVRVVFIASVFLGGLGLVAYLAAWLLVPEKGGEQPIAHSARRVPTWLLIGVLSIASIAVIAQVSDAWDGGLFWAAVLIVAGVLLYRRDVAPPRAEAPADVPDIPSSRSAINVTEPLPQVKRQRRERSYLGRYAFATMLLALGITASLHNAGVISPEPEQYPALALLVIGAGLLVGTLWGKADWLMLLGLFVVIPTALAASLVDVPFEGGTGSRVYTPVVADDLAEEYRLVAGRMEFDLTGLTWGTEPITIEATAVAGEIVVVVPRGVMVDFDGRVGAGAIDLFGYSRDGYATEIHSDGNGPATDRSVVIDAEVSFGHIEIVRSPIDAKGI